MRHDVPPPRGRGPHRALLAAGLLAAAAGACLSLLLARARPPAEVWTLRGPRSLGHESLTVHVRPAGDAVRGRWVLVEQAIRDRAAGVVLLRLPLRDEDGADLLARVLAGDEARYRPAGGTEAVSGSVWYAWTRE